MKIPSRTLILIILVFYSTCEDNNIINELEYLEENNSNKILEMKDYYISKILSKGNQNEPTRILRASQENDHPKRYFKNMTYTAKIADLPQSAFLNVSPWSGSYWPLKHGLLSSRYHPHKWINSNYETVKEGDKLIQKFRTYNSSIAVYSQPEDYNRTKDIYLNYSDYVNLYFSPSEKYDFLIGDYNFTLTNRMKLDGKKGIKLDENYDIPSWMGICHGWAIASYKENKPNRTVTLLASDGKTKVQFLPDDIKGLLSMYWAEANYESNLAGYRCRAKNFSEIPVDPITGLYTNYDCFGINPASFHTIVTNMIGFYQQGFVFEPVIDDEIWNHPAYGYNYTYFNPLNNLSKSLNESIITVDEAKMFDQPLINFIIKNLSPNTTHLVGVMMRMDYVYETNPVHNKVTLKEEYMNATYFYILELDSEGNAIGGEWFYNKHPNYIYGPRQGDEILWLEDKLYTQFELTPESFEKARRLSADKVRKRNSPLKAIIKYLIEQVYNETYVEDNTNWVDDPDILDRIYGIIRQDSSIPTLSPIKDLKYETKPDGTRVRNETYEDGVTVRAEITNSKVMKYITRPAEYKNITTVDVGLTIIKEDGTQIRNETMSDGNIHRVETTPDGKITRFIIKVPNITIEQTLNTTSVDNQGGENLNYTQPAIISSAGLNNDTQPIISTVTISPPTQPNTGVLIVPTEPFGTLPTTTSTPPSTTSTSSTASTPSTPSTIPQSNNTNSDNQPRTEVRADGTIVRYEPQSDGSMHRIETYPDGRIIRFIIRPITPITPVTPSSNNTLTSTGQPRTEVRADGTIVTYEPQPDGSIQRVERYPDGRIIRFIPRPRSPTSTPPVTTPTPPVTTPTQPVTTPTPPVTTPTQPVTTPTQPVTTPTPPVTTPTQPVTAPTPDRTETRPDGTIVTYQTQPDGTIHRIERYPDGRTIRFIPRNPSRPSTTSPSNSVSNSQPTPQTNNLPPSEIRPDGTIVRYERQPDGSIQRIESTPNGRTTRYYTAPVTVPRTPTTTSSSPLSTPRITYETRPDGTRIRIETYPNGRVVRYIIRTVRSSSTSNLRSP